MNDKKLDEKTLSKIDNLIENYQNSFKAALIGKYESATTIIKSRDPIYPIIKEFEDKIKNMVDIADNEDIEVKVVRKKMMGFMELGRQLAHLDKNTDEQLEKFYKEKNRIEYDMEYRIHKANKEISLCENLNDVKNVLVKFHIVSKDYDIMNIFRDNYDYDEEYYEDENYWRDEDVIILLSNDEDDEENEENKEDCF